MCAVREGPWAERAIEPNAPNANHSRARAPPPSGNPKTEPARSHVRPDLAWRVAGTSLLLLLLKPQRLLLVAGAIALARSTSMVGAQPCLRAVQLRLSTI